MEQGNKNPGKGFNRLALLALGLLAMASACGYRVVGSEPVGARPNQGHAGHPAF